MCSQYHHMLRGWYGFIRLLQNPTSASRIISPSQVIVQVAPPGPPGAAGPQGLIGDKASAHVAPQIAILQRPASLALPPLSDRGVPQGMTGASGLQGPIGRQGPRGPPGPQGDQGQQGQQVSRTT